MIKERLNLGPDSLVVELASNDGYLLQHFLPLGVPVLGIEPADERSSGRHREGHPDPHRFLRRRAREQSWSARARRLIYRRQQRAGSGSGPQRFRCRHRASTKARRRHHARIPAHRQRLMAENQFDTIYHEHFSYFSLSTMEQLAARHGLKVRRRGASTHGGSLRVYLAHAASARSQPPRGGCDRSKKRSTGTFDYPATQAFGEQVKRTKRKLLSFLISAKNAGKNICGYGAPGKGNTLLNYCGIGTDFLDFTVDRNPYKHGRFTPGMHIPIYPVEAIAEAKPDYILILPWNLKTRDHPADALRQGWGGKFIVPIPEFRSSIQRNM